MIDKITTSRITLDNGYTFSRVINGGWQLSAEHCLKGRLDIDDAIKGFHMAKERGLTTFDCADIYTGVEEILGRFVNELKAMGGYSHEDIQIHTKFVPDLGVLDQVDLTYTEKVVDRSLMRMHRDCLDLVQFHWWDYDVPGMMETAYDLVRLQEKGKIRNIAMCNFDTPHLAQMIEAKIPVVSNQTQYSVFDRRPEKALLPYSREHDVYSFCYGALSGGFLAERWIGVRREDFEPETRSHVKYLQIIEDSLGWEGYQKILLLLKDIADRHQVSIANVAVRYILDQPGVGAVMIGCRSSRHVEDNARLLDFDLSDEEIQRIRAFVEAYPTPEGEPFTLERTPGSKYRNIMKMDLNKA
ncbi:MAG: aldo/keto reductase [Lachnospiraceae bacterium]|nr:aldo/keto reductase [Lachnospiraceae bacterium]